VVAAELKTDRLLVADLAGTPFEISLRPDTIFVDGGEMPADCAAIVPELRIAIDGTAIPGEPGRIIAARVVLAPAPKTPLERPRSRPDRARYGRHPTRRDADRLRRDPGRRPGGRPRNLPAARSRRDPGRSPPRQSASEPGRAAPLRRLLDAHRLHDRRARAV